MKSALNTAREYTSNSPNVQRTLVRRELTDQEKADRASAWARIEASAAQGRARRGEK